jgi:hypothetical protein
VRRFISYPHIVSTLALLVALSGGAYAAGLVGTSQIKNGAVTTPKIHKHAVTTSRLAPKVTASILAAAAAVAPRAYEVSDSGIQQIGQGGLDLATLSLPEAGTYLVTGSLRVFPRAANPGHNLACSMSGSAGGNIFLSNVWVEDSQVEQVPVTGLITMLGSGSVPLTCRQISGAGEITATYDLVAVKVVPGP